MITTFHNTRWAPHHQLDVHNRKSARQNARRAYPKPAAHQDDIKEPKPLCRVTSRAGREWRPVSCADEDKAFEASLARERPAKREADSRVARAVSFSGSPGCVSLGA
jgi:hypothetical protein